jgi:hypothetical protein
MVRIRRKSEPLTAPPWVVLPGGGAGQPDAHRTSTHVITHPLTEGDLDRALTLRSCPFRHVPPVADGVSWPRSTPPSGGRQSTAVPSERVLGCRRSSSRSGRGGVAPCQGMEVGAGLGRDRVLISVTRPSRRTGPRSSGGATGWPSGKDHQWVRGT